MAITKKIKIYIEEAYRDTIWCKELLDGLIKELKKRRLAFEESTDIEVPEDFCGIILGMNREWVEGCIQKCNAAGVSPVVLSNQSQENLKGSYYLVCPDVLGAARELKEALRLAGRKRIALYGSNGKNDLDKCRTEIFAEMISKAEDIYPNNGNLEKCFRTFLPKAAAYDGVLCINGYAAISLVKKLEKENPQLLDQLEILTFEEVLKHSKYNQWISCMKMNLESYGSAALQLLELFSQREDISGITVTMRCDLCEVSQKQGNESEISEGFEMDFEDPEIIQMAKIEQLLRDADDMDHHIIAMLLDHATYGDIADSCYMTEGNVKYRVKKYMSVSGCNTKKELIELLQEYLQ